MSYQDGRRVEALEAAVRDLLATLAETAAIRQQNDDGLRELRERIERLEARLTDRPALARRRA